MLYDQFLTYAESSGDQLYAHCPFHNDDTPSLTINKDTHEWYCHGCGVGGVEKEFVSLEFDVPIDIAKYAIAYYETRGKWPFPSTPEVEKWHEDLLANSGELSEVYSFGFSDATIKDLKIGFDGQRIIFPIKSKTGYYVNARKYLPPHRRDKTKKEGKCLNIQKLGSKRLYPYSAFDEQTIFVVEGEKDCVAARSQGLNAVTGTGGSALPVEEFALFYDKDVYLMLDTDGVGEKSTATYARLLHSIARSIKIIRLPAKDFVDFYIMQKGKKFDVLDYVVEVEEIVNEGTFEGDAKEESLTRSEFTDNLNSWVKLSGMSVVGVEPKVYTIPSKLKAICKNTKCTKPCPLVLSGSSDANIITIDPRQILQFVDSADSVQDTYVRKIFGCRSVVAEPIEFINVQKIIFQESASFIDGLDDASFEHRYGLYLYDDYRLSATLKYNFEACRVTDPKNQQNYYVIRSAENVESKEPPADDSILDYFRERSDAASASELLEQYYEEWLPTLAIEERPDLFGALILTYCSVTEIPWASGIIKGWLDTMVIGDTRTGKSQMAQRFIKAIGLGGYINGENARRTGVIGGIQSFGNSWVVTWGAIPMNDRGLLIIDEASGLDIEDIKDLSSTRSSGAVTLHKIVKGEARARTRLLWLSNPRSGRNLSEFYWKGFGAFQEFIPVAEDQARYDLLLTAAREDVEYLEGVEETHKPNMEAWRGLFSLAWSLRSDEVVIDKSLRQKVRDTVRGLNEDFGGGPLIVGVAAHEKLLRITCAFAVLMGSFKGRSLIVDERHLQFADEFLRETLSKHSLGYAEYVGEYQRAQTKKAENVDFIRALVAIHPALKVLLSSSSFKGFQFQEILGLDRMEGSKIMSDLITRGLLRPAAGGTYVPDKLLMDIAKQMEV